MADDDNFDIDIYGDEGPEFVAEPQPQQSQKQDDNGNIAGLDGANDEKQITEPETEPPLESTTDIKQDPEDVTFEGTDDHAVKSETPQQQNQQIASTVASSAGQLNLPRQAPTQQGIKRQEGEDDREIDPGATAALRLGELQWWITEDDIRGWINQCGCEDELKDLTFNEHKVNGKSKGEAFVELASPQAATALKRRIDSFGAEQQQYVKKHTVIYVRPDHNPFRSSPKDAPQRNKSATAGAYNSGPGFQQGGGGFRGGRGGYNRGGMQNMNHANNMNGGMGGMGRSGYTNPMNNQMGMMAGGFNGFNSNNMMGGGGFGGPMGGGFNNRGGMMNNMRGGYQNNRGRGGMMGNMGMMPTMAMGMPGMTPGTMMGGMGMGGMAGGYNNNTAAAGGHFNPNFFAGNMNPAAAMPPADNHRAKRPRPE